MATDQSDQFIMLLSTDWFSPYWATFGLVFSESEQQTVREVSRKVTKDLLKGADTYWGASFTDDRISATRSSFIDSLRKTRLGAAGVSQLSDALNAASESAEFATTSWLFGALCDQLGSPTGDLTLPNLSSYSIETAKSLWQLSASVEPDGKLIERALKTSTTDWDKWLRKATPDLPTYLSDWAMTRLRRPDRFRVFWAQLFWTISREDRRTLKKWLEGEAIKLAAPSFALAEPDWMHVE